jgi:hypothetical protein
MKMTELLAHADIKDHPGDAEIPIRLARQLVKCCRDFSDSPIVWIAALEIADSLLPFENVAKVAETGADLTGTADACHEDERAKRMADRFERMMRDVDASPPPPPPSDPARDPGQ